MEVIRSRLCRRRCRAAARVGLAQPFTVWTAAVVGVVLAVAAALLGGAALVYRHLYHVSLFDPDAAPERVQACGRSFLITDPLAVADLDGVQAREPDRAPLTDLTTVTAPLHAPMLVYGRPQDPGCGAEVFVGPDTDHLAAYVLQGGP